MSAERRIQVYEGPPMTAAFEALGEAWRDQRSGRLNTVCERYMAMVDDELARLDLTRQEWLAILEANNGVEPWTGHSGGVAAVLVWANLHDHRGDGSHWGVDKDALVRKLQALPRSTLTAIVEACDRFWSRDGVAVDAALEQAGIRPRP